MQYDPMTPIWLQVANMLREDIATGRLEPGQKLPGGRDLALQYEINPNTAARVYQELERAGLCVTRRGMGTYVTRDEARIQSLRQEMAQSAVRRCMRSLRNLGFSREEAFQLVQTEEKEYAEE